MMTSCTWLSRSPAPLIRMKRALSFNSGNRSASHVAHAAAQAADHLVDDHRHGAAIGNASFDAFRTSLFSRLPSSSVAMPELSASTDWK